MMPKHYWTNIITIGRKLLFLSNAFVINVFNQSHPKKEIEPTKISLEKRLEKNRKLSLVSNGTYTK